MPNGSSLRKGTEIKWDQCFMAWSFAVTGHCFVLSWSYRRMSTWNGAYDTTDHDSRFKWELW